jgi:hypothetical protein
LASNDLKFPLTLPLSPTGEREGVRGKYQKKILKFKHVRI